jgi:hypothetical protein
MLRVDDVPDLGLGDEVLIGSRGTESDVVGGDDDPALLEHERQEGRHIAYRVARSGRHAGFAYPEGAVLPGDDGASSGRGGSIGEEEHSAGHSPSAVGTL